LSPSPLQQQSSSISSWAKGIGCPHGSSLCRSQQTWRRPGASGGAKPHAKKGTKSAPGAWPWPPGRCSSPTSLQRA
jgi:hypothetical protein